MTEKNLTYILKHSKIIVDENLNCDPKFLNNLLKSAGMPGRTINMEKIRWEPYSFV